MDFYKQGGLLMAAFSLACFLTAMPAVGQTYTANPPSNVQVTPHPEEPIVAWTDPASRVPHAVVQLSVSPANESVLLSAGIEGPDVGGWAFRASPDRNILEYDGPWENISCPRAAVTCRELTHTVGGLENGRTYYFRVRSGGATNQASEIVSATPSGSGSGNTGSGDTGSGSGGNTGSGTDSGSGGGDTGGSSGIAPAVPTFLRAVPENASASLSWQTADDNGGAAISHYAFGYKKGNERFGQWTDIPESAPGEANANAYAIPDTLEGGILYTFRLRAVNETGTHGDYTAAAVFLSVSTHTEKEELPDAVALLGNYPNPFNPQTRIEYALPSPVHVRLAVYDMQGRLKRVLENGVRPAGRHTAVFDAGDLPGGVYAYRLETPEGIVTRIMTLVK